MAQGTLYDKRNDAVRIDSLSDLDRFVSSAVREFFRHLDVAHLFEERILPSFDSDDSTLFVAIRERPWPPWGLGGQRVAALSQAVLIGSRSYGLGPMYVAAEDSANIGLRAALYKEILEHLTRRETAEVNYLVIEGSVLADRILRANGFARTDDKVLTHEAQYNFYRTEVRALLDKLHLSKVSLPELLANQMDETTLTANALFQGMLELATQPTGRFEFGREIIAIEGNLLQTSLPGGSGSPTPPSGSPSEIPGIGGGDPSGGGGAVNR